jgi:hypothetical protein
MDTSTPIFQLYAKRKTAKEKLAFIYLRITYQTDVIDKSTGIFCEYRLWKPESGMIKSNQLLTQQLKDQVEMIKHKILGAFYILRQTAPEISLREIVAVALEGEKSKAYSVFTCFESVIEKMKASNGKGGASQANIQKHGVVLKHLRAFVSTEHRWNDMPFARINRTFVDGFLTYLKNECNCSHNTAMKQMGIFKKIYKIAVDNNWIKTNAFSGFRMGLKPVIRTILTEEEIREVAIKQISIKRIDFIRDMFIFSCFSGLAYIDFKNRKS